MKIMVGNAAKGGMRTVVESYRSDHFFAKHNIKLINSYREGHFAYRQIVFVLAYVRFVGCLIFGNVDLVHLHAAQRGSFWRKAILMLTARVFRVPVIVHLHGSEMKLFYNGQKKRGRSAIRWMFEHAERVIVLSKSWQVWVSSVAPASSVTVVPNYVRIPTFTKPDNDIISIVFLGMIGKRKGVLDLIAAMKSVRQRYPKVYLTIGGNGDQALAEALVKSFDLQDCITFAGWVGPDERAKLLEAADIYVLPSYNEGLPMGILEAMSYKTAVVSTAVGGIPELIESGHNGLLIRPGDAHGLADALLSLAEDADLRHALAEAGYQTVVSGYSDQVILPLLDRIYDECTKSSGKNRKTAARKGAA